MLQRAILMLEAVQHVADDFPAMVLCVRLAAILTAQTLDGTSRPDRSTRAPIPIDTVLAECRSDLRHLHKQTAAASWALMTLRNGAYVKAAKSPTDKIMWSHATPEQLAVDQNEISDLGEDRENRDKSFVQHRYRAVLQLQGGGNRFIT